MRLIPIVEIIRLAEVPGLGTMGAMRVQKVPVCLTMEREDLLNAQNMSSIPAQQYLCRRVNSPKFGNTFEVVGVPGRSAVLFHKGNTQEDSHGCILLGSKFADNAVAESAPAFEKFLKLMDGHDEFHLTIVEHY
ncbi:MAG: hypothetical protein KKE73_10855 [Proteobacteria bacterium]|nr:hypothetical protein [Pseudomonadota bacterium]